jgi:hypothetical protein
MIVELLVIALLSIIWSPPFLYSFRWSACMPNRRCRNAILHLRFPSILIPVPSPVLIKDSVPESATKEPKNEGEWARGPPPAKNGPYEGVPEFREWRWGSGYGCSNIERLWVRLRLLHEWAVAIVQGSHCCTCTWIAIPIHHEPLLPKIPWLDPNRNHCLLIELESKPIVKTVLFGGNRGFVRRDTDYRDSGIVRLPKGKRRALYVLVQKEPGSRPDIVYDIVRLFRNNRRARFIDLPPRGPMRAKDEKRKRQRKTKDGWRMNRKDEKTRRRRHHSNSAVTGCAMRKDSSLQQDQTVGDGNKQDQQGDKKNISRLHTVKHSAHATVKQSAHAHIECPLQSPLLQKTQSLSLTKQTKQWNRPGTSVDQLQTCTEIIVVS